MRRRGALGALAAAAALAAPGVAQAAPGDLDPSFGEHGVATQAGPAGSEPVVTPDGGAALLVEGESPAIVKVDRFGALDASFGDGGRAALEDERFDPSSLARGPDGDLYVGGTLDRFDQDSTVAVKRFDADGTQDLEYGGDGTAEIDDPDAQFDSAGGIAVHDQDVLIGMNLAGVSGESIALGKLDETGNVDEGFGSAGTTDPIADFWARVAVDGDQYLLGGAGDFSDVNVARYTDRGQLVESFGQGGVLTVPGNSLSDFAIGPEGRLALVFGWENPLPPAKSSEPLRVASFTRDGEPLPGFDPSDALIQNEQTGRSFFVRGVTYDDVGRIVLTGAWEAESFYQQGSHPMVARIEPDGSLDRRFGDRGFSRFPARGIGVSHLTGVAIDARGRILATARSFEQDANGDTVTALVRFLSSPGRRDADADGVRDGRDACPRVFSTRKGGCPRHAVRVAAKKRGDGLAGAVTGKRGCFYFRMRDGSRRAERLVIKRKVRGPDKAVGKAVIHRSDRDWAFGPRRPGTYYAQYRATVKPEFGLCRAARSKPVRIG